MTYAKKSPQLRTYSSVKERRDAVGAFLKTDLTHTGSFSLDEGVASTRNCENMIGISQIPMGVAGPITIRHSGGETVTHYIPLATTEGALVASVSRGCRVVEESGGLSVLASRVGASRGPVFKVRNLAENTELYDFIMKNQDEFARVAKTTSGHISLTHVETNSVGLYRFVRFIFDTQDAMGLNMVTIATDRIVRYIEIETGAHCTSLSGNFCVDKKPSWLNFTRNRGFEVWAECVIPGTVLRDVLHVSPEVFYETWLSKCMIGSAISGSMGFNAQYANVLSALFIATGQDPAHVAECAIGITTAEIRGDGVYVGIYLPDLMIGTVGGGTTLSTQTEALRMLGVCGGNDGKNSQKLGEITGAAVLAGEISLLSSLGEGTLAQSHARLARGGK